MFLQIIATEADAVTVTCTVTVLPTSIANGRTHHSFPMSADPRSAQDSVPTTPNASVANADGSGSARDAKASVNFMHCENMI